MCASFTLTAQTVTTVNGVRTVVYGANAKPKGQWSINPKPLQTISDGEGIDLLDIIAMVRQSDGTLVVASNKTTDLRFFSAAGKHLKNVGRQGSGPGEFNGLWNVFRIRDSLVTTDGLSLMQVFTPDGKYVRTEPRPNAGPKGERVALLGFFADGRALMRMQAARDTTGPARKLIFNTLHLKSRSGLTQVGKYPSYERVKMRGTPLTSAQFGAIGSVAVLPKNFCVGFSDAMTFNCFTPEGKQVSHVERPAAVGRVVTAADKEAFLHANDVANPGPQGEGIRKLMRENTTYAERMPAFGRVIGGTNDEIWVGPDLIEDVGTAVSPVPDKPTKWSVYSVNGDWMSDITLPKRFRLLEAGANYVAGILKDDDDIESVIVYSIVKR